MQDLVECDGVPGGAGEAGRVGRGSLVRVVVAAAVLTAGCHGHAATYAAATTVVAPEGSFVAGEAVLSLEPGAAPPAAVGALRCQPGAWAAERVVVVHCDPIGAEGADTARLVEALRTAPGVRSADFNWIRTGQKK